MDSMEITNHPTFALLLEEYRKILRSMLHKDTYRIESSVRQLMRDITKQNMSTACQINFLRARIQEVPDLAAERRKIPRKNANQKDLCKDFRPHALKIIEKRVPVEELNDFIRRAGMSGRRSGALAELEDELRITFREDYPHHFATLQKVAAFDRWRKHSGQHLSTRRLLEMSQRERVDSNPPLAGLDEVESVRLPESELRQRAGLHALRHCAPAKRGHEMDGLDCLADVALSSASADCEISTGVSIRCFPITRASIINLVNFAAAS
jgi:hypothetical protein